VSRLLQWLKIEFGNDKGADGRYLPSFTDLGNVVKTGTQNDMSACGIFALNAIRHAVLEEPILKQDDVPLTRMQYFLDILGKYHEEVRVDSDINSWSILLTESFRLKSSFLH
jgi:hypothetical protein